MGLLSAAAQCLEREAAEFVEEVRVEAQLFIVQMLHHQVAVLDGRERYL